MALSQTLSPQDSETLSAEQGRKTMWVAPRDHLGLAAVRADRGSRVTHQYYREALKARVATLAQEAGVARAHRVLADVLGVEWWAAANPDSRNPESLAESLLPFLEERSAAVLAATDALLEAEGDLLVKDKDLRPYSQIHLPFRQWAREVLRIPDEGPEED